VAVTRNVTTLAMDKSVLSQGPEKAILVKKAGHKVKPKSIKKTLKASPSISKLSLKKHDKKIENKIIALKK
jgi:hypothetical protein